MLDVLSLRLTREREADMGADRGSDAADDETFECLCSEENQIVRHMSARAPQRQ